MDPKNPNNIEELYTYLKGLYSREKETASSFFVKNFLGFDKKTAFTEEETILLENILKLMQRGHLTFEDKGLVKDIPVFAWAEIFSNTRLVDYLCTFEKDQLIGKINCGMLSVFKQTLAHKAEESQPKKIKDISSFSCAISQLAKGYLWIACYYQSDQMYFPVQHDTNSTAQSIICILLDSNYGYWSSAITMGQPWFDFSFLEIRELPFVTRQKIALPKLPQFRVKVSDSGESQLSLAEFKFIGFSANDAKRYNKLLIKVVKDYVEGHITLDDFNKQKKILFNVLECCAKKKSFYDERIPLVMNSLQEFFIKFETINQIPKEKRTELQETKLAQLEELSKEIIREVTNFINQLIEVQLRGGSTDEQNAKKDQVAAVCLTNLARTMNRYAQKTEIAGRHNEIIDVVKETFLYVMTALFTLPFLGLLWLADDFCAFCKENFSLNKTEKALRQSATKLAENAKKLRDASEPVIAVSPIVSQLKKPLDDLFNQPEFKDFFEKNSQEAIKKNSLLHSLNNFIVETKSTKRGFFNSDPRSILQEAIKLINATEFAHACLTEQIKEIVSAVSPDKVVRLSAQLRRR